MIVTFNDCGVGSFKADALTQLHRLLGTYPPVGPGLVNRLKAGAIDGNSYTSWKTRGGYQVGCILGAAYMEMWPQRVPYLMGEEFSPTEVLALINWADSFRQDEINHRALEAMGDLIHTGDTPENSEIVKWLVEAIEDFYRPKPYLGIQDVLKLLLVKEEVNV